MNDREVANTTLAMAGAALALHSELIETLISLKVMPASEVLATVQRARRKLEGSGQPGGVRASIFLEPVEEDVRRHTGD